jgi:Rab family protein
MNGVRHDDDYNYLFKIILIGDAGVGKTYLLSRYINEDIPRKKGPTIGVEFATKTISLANGGTVKAQIWDTAGTERFKAITSAHYRKSVGALVVYDVTKRESFLHVKKWLDELKDHAEPDIVIVLVGNKVDLVQADPAERQVSVEEA